MRVAVPGALSRFLSHMSRKSTNSEAFTVAEFFSGCGGFTRGFLRTGNFRSVLANDIKPEALATFKLNNSTGNMAPGIVREDIRKIPIAELKSKLREQGVRSGELDCMIGGPPCQGFSQLRRSEIQEDGAGRKFRGYSKMSEDPRNDLVLRFLEIAEALQPKCLVIENVPQMLTHGFKGRFGRLAEEIVGILENDLKYHVDVGVLNAANYGVPQLRERAVFIAHSTKGVKLPSPTHQGSAEPDKGKLKWVTVRDAIGDLPAPSTLEVEGGLKHRYSVASSRFVTLMKGKSGFIHNHLTRSYDDKVLNIVQEMIPGETWDAGSQRMIERYESEIEDFAKRKRCSKAKARAELINSGEINLAFYKRYYWSAYTRLAWDAPALTITANANFLGSGRFTHPEQLRGITVREAARLQSFDDDFIVNTCDSDKIDTSRIGVGMDMIGEAVPPLLAEAIARQVIKPWING